jgi:PAS domain S-box-containing protein
MSTESDRLTSPKFNLPDFPSPLDETQLNALFAGVSDAVYIEDLDSSRVVYWSPRAASVFGYSAAEVLQQSGARLLADENDLEGTASAARDLKSGGFWQGRRRFRRSGGDLFDAAASVTLWRSPPGDYAVHAVRAASARNPAEAPRFDEWANPQIFEVLNQTEQLQIGGERRYGEQMIGHLLRNVVNFALFTTDSNGCIGDWNNAATGLLGYERADVAGKHLSLIREEDEHASGELLRRACERGTARSNQWLVRKDGKRVYANVAAFALGSTAEARGFLFLVRDASRERSLREKVREREQMAAIGTAAAMLAHEIGNPLNGISATVQLLEQFVLRDNPPMAQSMLSSVGDLKSEIQRLTTLLNEFKNIAWPQKLALAPIDLARLLQTLVGAMEKRAARQKIEVSADCAPGLPPLEGDADKLKEALLHVVENALDAMPQGGSLAIKAYSADDTICIDISDSGIGIPEDFKVFDLFSSTKPHGTGFGLFIVQQIVLAHDGAITYSSIPGQGTTFHLTFNAHPSPEPLSDEFVQGG